MVKAFIKKNRILVSVEPDNIKDADTQDIKMEQGEKITPSQKHKLSFPLPPGTIWENVTIIQLPSKSFQIAVSGDSETFTLSQLDLVNKRNRKPSALGVLFIALCVWRGEIPSEKFEEKYLYQTSQLNNHLQKLFGINDSIFVGHYKKIGAWKTKIVFSDRYYQSSDINLQKLQSDFGDSDTE